MSDEHPYAHCCDCCALAAGCTASVGGLHPVKASFAVSRLNCSVTAQPQAAESDQCPVPGDRCFLPCTPPHHESRYCRRGPVLLPLSIPPTCQPLPAF